MMINHNDPNTRPHTARVCLAFLCGAIFTLAPGCSDDSNPPATTTNNDTGACRMTAGGIEICDGVDNDCDGEVDEDYNVGESCNAQGCDDPGTRACSEDQTSTMCERPLSCLGDMGDVDMPEDEGQPDQSEPCDDACGGQTPICDVATDTCVQCLNNNDCANGVCDTTAKSCVACLGDEDCTGEGVCLEANDTQDNACVECRGNAECLDAQASLCSAQNECAPCADDADCSHLQDLGQCVAGTCRECTTESEATDCAGNVCDPTTYACTNLPIGNTGQLQTCVSDTQCATGNACIPLNYMGAPHGNYCMPIYSGSGTCPKPYGAPVFTGASLNGAQVTVCIINGGSTTPEAVNAYFTICTDDDDCPGDAGICRVFDPGTNPPTNACTYACGGDRDCRAGSVCPAGLDYCRPQ